MSYVNILSRLDGAAVLLSESKLRIITEAVTIPLLLNDRDSIANVPSLIHDPGKAELSYGYSDSYKPSPEDIYQINVFDSLVSKNASAGSGMTSYERIASRLDGAVARGFKRILFYIDSPGGEATGLFGLTSKIRDLRAKGIETIGYADNATSAAYAILAATQKAYAAPTAVLGSIAAIMAHVETSKRDAAQGLTYTIFRSKEEKALADSRTPLSDTAKQKITTMLETLDIAFNNDVVMSRPNLTIKAIKEMKGSEFMAEEALKLGLIDGLAINLDAVVNSKFSHKPAGVKMELEELKAKLEAAEKQNASLTAQITELQLSVEKATTDERTRCLTILETVATLNLSADLAKSHISAGYDVNLSQDTLKQIASMKTESLATIGNGASATVHLEEGTRQNNAPTLRAAFAKATGRKDLLTNHQ